MSPPIIGGLLLGSSVILSRKIVSEPIVCCFTTLRLTRYTARLFPQKIYTSVHVSLSRNGALEFKNAKTEDS